MCLNWNHSHCYLLIQMIPFLDWFSERTRSSIKIWTFWVLSLHAWVFFSSCYAGLQILCSMTRDWTRACTVKVANPNARPPGNCHTSGFLMEGFSLSLSLFKRKWYGEIWASQVAYWYTILLAMQDMRFRFLGLGRLLGGENVNPL